jgi:hypothetical protein
VYCRQQYKPQCYLRHRDPSKQVVKCSSILFLLVQLVARFQCFWFWFATPLPGEHMSLSGHKAWKYQWLGKVLLPHHNLVTLVGLVSVNIGSSIFLIYWSRHTISCSLCVLCAYLIFPISCQFQVVVLRTLASVDECTQVSTNALMRNSWLRKYCLYPNWRWSLGSYPQQIT